MPWLYAQQHRGVAFPARCLMLAVPLPFADDLVLLAAARHWAALRRCRRMPDHADLDAIQLPRFILPHLVLAEPAEGKAGAIRFRLVGTAMVERFQTDFTGRTTADVMSGSYRIYIESLFSRCLEREAPVYSESTFRWDVAGFATTRRLMMPLSRGAESARMILVAQTWPSQGLGVLPAWKVIDGSRFEAGICEVLEAGQLSGLS